MRENYKGIAIGGDWDGRVIENSLPQVKYWTRQSPESDELSEEKSYVWIRGMVDEKGHFGFWVSPQIPDDDQFNYVLAQLINNYKKG